MRLPEISKDQLEAASARERRHLEQRQALWRTALEDALIHEKQIKGAMASSKGWWLDSMGPLTAQERTAIIGWLKQHWGLPP